VRVRLLASTVLIAVISVLALGLPLGVVGGRLLERSVGERLEREADTAAGGLAAEHARGRPIDARLLASLASPGHRLEVRLPGGRVIAGGARLAGDVVRSPSGDASSRVRVTVVAPAAERGERVGGVWLAVLVLSLLALAAAVVLALAQARRLAGPLERLARRAATVGQPGFGASARASGVGEVDAVEDALTHADERIQALVAREREFAANASHQLRTPLTGLRMRLEELRALAPGGSAGEQEADAALEQADRLEATIAHLEALARRHELGPASADLGTVARAHVERVWTARFAASERPLTLEAPASLVVRMDEEGLRQVLDVLLDNALRHGDGRTAVTAARDHRWARLSVQDDGPGVPAGADARIFERRTSLNGGSGVGLAVARDLVRWAGGELTLAARRPACFEARVPAAHAE
jgi:signal transduction histidine kinase